MSDTVKDYEALTRSDDVNYYLINYILPFLDTVDETTLKPQVSIDGRIYYNIGATELTYEEMLKMHKVNVLSIVDEKAFPMCAKCDSFSLHVELGCPYCKEQNLRKSELMKHYECDYIGSVEEFASKEDSLFVCPKCKKSLKRVGIDYGMPGIGFICYTCKNFFQFPLINIVCNKGHTSKVDELNLKSFPIFTLNKEVRGYTIMTKCIDAIESAFSKYNLKVAKFACIRGSSGKEYIVPFLVKNGKKQIIIDFICDDQGIKVDLAKFVRRVYDSMNSNKLKFAIVSERITDIITRTIDLADLDEYFTVLLVSPQMADRLYSIIRMEKIKILEVSDPLTYKDVIAREVIKLAS